MISSVCAKLSSIRGLDNSHKSASPPPSRMIAARNSAFSLGHLLTDRTSTALPCGCQAQPMEFFTASSISFRLTWRPHRQRSSSNTMISGSQMGVKCRATMKSQSWTPSPAWGGAASISCKTVEAGGSLATSLSILKSAARTDSKSYKTLRVPGSRINGISFRCRQVLRVLRQTGIFSKS